MNIKLYRKCSLYRQFFKEELMIRKMYINQDKIRHKLQDKLNASAELYERYMKEGHYKFALEAMAYYIRTYNILYK